jgi:hypothetical protein
MSQLQAQWRPITGNGVALGSTDREGGSSPDAGYCSNNQNWRQPAKATSDFSPQDGPRNHLTTSNNGKVRSPTEVGRG